MSNPYLDALEAVLDENPGIGRNEACRMANSRLPSGVSPRELKRWYDPLKTKRGREIAKRFNQVSHSGQSAQNNEEIVSTGAINLQERLVAAGHDPTTVPALWDKSSGDLSIYVKNPHYVEGVDINKLRRRLIHEMSSYAPKYSSPDYETPQHTTSKNGKLLVISPADIHLAKANPKDTASLKEAKERVTSAIASILQNSKSFYNVDHICLIIGNDVLHSEPTGATTRGTLQERNSTWENEYHCAKAMYIEIIEECVKVAKTDCLYVVDNHAAYTSYVLCDSLHSWFHNHELVHFSLVNDSRRYYVYGPNLLLFTHGDKAKEKLLPSLIRTEAKAAYAKCDHVYAFCHHKHHRQRRNYTPDGVQELELDTEGITVIKTSYSHETKDTVHVEYVRSANPTQDKWHRDYGYCMEKSSIEGFIFGQNGQEARFTQLC